MASRRADFEFDADHALGTGEYYTNAYAEQSLSASDDLATRQFVEPGFHLEFRSAAPGTSSICPTYRM